ncbi:hypothetical protein [Microbispora sp. H11081]|jgi:hypothetical protein|nr:hypothetical protein [Microbispora sp. H11081]
MTAEARMTEALMTEKTRSPAQAPRVAARQTALSGIVVIAQLHRVSEDM